jgi:hypothetical protein
VVRLVSRRASCSPQVEEAAVPSLKLIAWVAVISLGTSIALERYRAKAAR